MITTTTGQTSHRGTGQIAIPESSERNIVNRGMSWLLEINAWHTWMQLIFPLVGLRRRCLPRAAAATATDRAVRRTERVTAAIG